MLLLRHHQPQARFAGWAFVCLTVIFVMIAQTNISAGLSGLGTVLVLATILTAANKERIWMNYKKTYKYRKTDMLPKMWTMPNRTYYLINVYVVLPLMFALGLASIAAAWMTT